VRLLAACWSFFFFYLEPRSLTRESPGTCTLGSGPTQIGSPNECARRLRFTLTAGTAAAAAVGIGGEHHRLPPPTDFFSLFSGLTALSYEPWMLKP